MSDASTQFAFLMRHAEHRGGHLTDDAAAHLDSLADRLDEWLTFEWRETPARRLQLVTLTTNSTGEVRATADHLGDALARTGRLDPAADWGVDPAVGPYAPDPVAVRAHLDRLLAATTTTCAPLVVSNAPLVEWLATLLVGAPFPIARGELVCFRRHAGGRWEVAWTISADGSAEVEAIVEKIKSKMSVATALGAVIVGLLTFVIKDVLPGASLWDWLAATALATAAVLYFAALFLYDSLQMPSRFWASRLSGAAPDSWTRRLLHGKRLVARPPSAAARVLHAAMLRVWFWVFTPATVLVGLGMVLLGLGATEPPTAAPLTLQPWQVATGAVVLGVVCSLWIALHRPDLGSAD